MSNGSVTWTYTYDASGHRKSRKGTTEYEYIYDGNRLSQMNIGDDVRYVFIYDEERPMALRVYNGEAVTTYYYVTNLQGDVVAILNKAGKAIVEYSYDAWGNVESITGEYKGGLGLRNPLLYRGYVYDRETKLYYLNSSYYDPETGRFLNTDIYPSTGQGLIGNNMYAYCGNNPVIRKDSTGTAWETIFDIISLGMSIADVAANPRSIWAWAGLVGDAIDLIPFVTGVGEVTRAAKVIDGVDSVIDTGKTVVSKTDSLVDISEGACFTAGTMILTEDGEICIQDIHAGDKVWSENPETGEKGLKTVKQTFERETKEFVHIHVSGEEIITTPNHPFYVANVGWVESVQLRAGDVLVLHNGDYVIIEVVQHEILELPVTVYNFEVEDYHTYYVGVNHILVHNACGIRNTPDQDALIKIAKEVKRSGVTHQEADILWEWTKEVGLSGLKNYHAPKYDNYLGGTQFHLKINGMHINIFK